MDLEIVYQDNFLVAINKPHGLLVHRSRIANDANEFAVQKLRDQIGQKVFPVHRIDRKTSGILLFALDDNTNSVLQTDFMEGRVDKRYLALVRGFTDDEGTIDYPLVREDGKQQEAVTKYKVLERIEIGLSSGKFPTSRYSLVEAHPITGRMHQIRKHFAHIFHPIVGDRPHGCNKQNKFFLEQFGHKEMLLHAQQLKFMHPEYGTEIFIESDLSPAFQGMLNILKEKQLNSFH